jgi:ABC-type proline/glycine betaine transport system permease subunit
MADLPSLDDLPRLEVGEWVESAVDWLNDNAGFVFDRVKDSLTWLYDGLIDLLTWPDPLLFAVLVALAAWRVRGVAFAAFSLLGLVLVDNLDLWSQSIHTLSLVLIAAGIAVLIGVPLGIIASRSGVVSAITRPVLDMMQTMPAFVYLIPAVSFFRIGAVPGIVATVVFSMPPAVRLTELGIRQVDSEVVEAGQAFGASPRRILFTVQLPLAKATIMAGINQVIMLALSMVVIAGMIGAGGLGGAVFTAVTRLRVGDGFEAGLAVVIIAVILDRFTSAFATERTAGGSRRRGFLLGRRRAESAESDPGADPDTEVDDSSDPLTVS